VNRRTSWACIPRFRPKSMSNCRKATWTNRAPCTGTASCAWRRPADEILPLRDPRVQQNEAYLAVIILSGG